MKGKDNKFNRADRTKRFQDRNLENEKFSKALGFGETDQEVEENAANRWIAHSTYDPKTGEKIWTF